METLSTELLRNEVNKMGRAKDIIVKVIPKDIAEAFVKRNHYSGKVVAYSILHFGVFLDGNLHGVMQFGGSLSKSKMLGLVENTGWNEYLELNRMAFDDYLPKNSESRAISIAIRLIKEKAPHIKWIVSFADGSQCGDGTIYRASGFLLTQIIKNTTMWKMPDGEVLSHMSFAPTIGTPHLLNKYGKVGQYSNWSSKRFLEHIKAVPIEGFQLRYIYLIDKNCKLNVPILSFEEIDKKGAGMYKSEKITIKERRE